MKSFAVSILIEVDVRHGRNYSIFCIEYIECKVSIPSRFGALGELLLVTLIFYCSWRQGIVHA